MSALWHQAATRLASSAIVIYLVVTTVFFLSRAVGDPISILAPIDANPEQLEEMKDREGLNDPLISQYGRFLASAARLDFGTSFRANQPATDVVLSRLRATVELGLTALALALIVGIPAGVLAATRRGTWTDLSVRVLALGGQATPGFWLGLMLIMLFAVRLGWLPTGGRGGFEHLILPAITLASFTTAAIVRFTRSAMLEVLQQDYVRTARATANALADLSYQILDPRLRTQIS